MNAIARTMPNPVRDEPSAATLMPRASICDDRSPASPTPETPWRSPLFYLAAIAAIVLLIAVGIVLLWRVVTRSSSL